MLAALALAVALGQFILEDPGFVVIGYGGKMLRTSFAFFVVLMTFAGVALYVLLRLLVGLLTARARLRRWAAERRRRRSHQDLNNGLLALAAGNYQEAERILNRSAAADVPAAHYLAAAQAAQGLNAPERRDGYLNLAVDSAPAAELAVALRRAEMQIESGENAEALATLSTLALKHAGNRQLLALRQRIFSATGAWDKLLDLLPALKRSRVYPAARLAEIEAEVAARLLAAPVETLPELKARWRGLPKSSRDQPVVVASYARDLIRIGAHEEAEALLRKALAERWDERLIRLYGELALPDPARAIEHAEAWLREHASDPALLLALGRLCLRAELWGKARAYLDQVCALAPTPLAHRLLAEVYDQLGEHETAARYRRTGLELATAPPPPFIVERPALQPGPSP